MFRYLNVVEIKRNKQNPDTLDVEKIFTDKHFVFPHPLSNICKEFSYRYPPLSLGDVLSPDSILPLWKALLLV